MRVTRYENRITISCTEHEFDILGIAVDQLEAGEAVRMLGEYGENPSGLRRAWSRRTSAGGFLRIDHDKRKNRRQAA